MSACPGETMDRLVGPWSILQLSRGHRFSTDDLLCAWAAVRAAPCAKRLLDLGAGLGSVGLMALWHMSADARLVMVEAQETSHRLARRTVTLNDLDRRVETRLGDLRDDGLFTEERFDLITCSPPYIPQGRGVLSPVPQRAAARVELRGSVYDYMRRARLSLAPTGRVALVFAAGDPRARDAVEAAGLSLKWWREVVFREGRPPTISLYVASLPAASDGLSERLPPLVVRDAAGRWTAEYQALRLSMSLPSA